VIDAMDEYQNIDQHQVDKVFEQVADVIRQAASVSIGCKISRDAALPWWTKEYAVIRSETGGRMGYALKIGIRLGTLCDAAQAEEQEMKRLKRALFSRDADATASLWRKEHGWAAWRAAKQLRDTRSDPCPQIVRGEASEPRMERK
jgi:hypothetical protein